MYARYTFRFVIFYLNHEIDPFQKERILIRKGGGGQDSKEFNRSMIQISASRIASISYSQLKNHFILIYCVLILLPVRPKKMQCA